MTNESNKEVVMVEASGVSPSPAQPQTVKAVPVQPQLVGAPVVVTGAVIGGIPPGAPPGGEWRHQSVVGVTSFIIAAVLGLFCCWICVLFPFCAPCDSKLVYVTPSGQVYKRNGEQVPEVACCLIYGQD
mmetsp:Transcript_6991/g.12398  ORF Transcript_6991/g.12398 Transcript_6991/m.12398 type:complete len:129 (+) Transcript_6991:136-522(+)|eukprot:CAMPEP_0197629556 /NCGR_PEP_ID=MMETSP1338-20131121/7362_1 /TAXON_ID=43686 ORGANISM="Pelagodinium beii, Strain RCC1491" /NCGR_SAMPLE_ID=MMETSP1338 /ASSEMBLY_ACC=CAM_ASM_000754 /LENGTH=128 /DNA_ID=CAMNT_0043200621 /DNA_START=49 /DNA_END=435 /DNA_ORIENTATION=+